VGKKLITSRFTVIHQANEGEEIREIKAEEEKNTSKYYQMIGYRF
jgi:hypothetical protein